MQVMSVIIMSDNIGTKMLIQILSTNGIVASMLERESSWFFWMARADANESCNHFLSISNIDLYHQMKTLIVQSLSSIKTVKLKSFKLSMSCPIPLNQ